MFKLLVSKTFVKRLIASKLFGPGISVLTIGPSGSSGKKGCSPLDEGEDATADAADAIVRD
jgi:hypothetical protein